MLGQLVRGGGERAVSNQDITGFLLSPAGVLFAVLTGLASGAMQLGQLGPATNCSRRAPSAGSRWGRSWRCGGCCASCPGSPAGGGHAAARGGGAPARHRTAGPAVFPAAGRTDINFYLATEPPEWRRTLVLAGLLLLLAAAAVAYLLLRWMLALPHFVATGESAPASLRASWRHTAGRGFRLAVPLLGWWAMWALASAALAAVFGGDSRCLLDFGSGRLERTALLLILVETTVLVAGTASNALGLAISQFIIAPNLS